MGIIGLLYYNKAVSETRSACKRDLKSAILSAEMDLRKACMYDRNFTFDPVRYEPLHVGLFDQNHTPVASSLHYHDTAFDRTLDRTPERIQMVKQLQQPVLHVRYIVSEDTRMPAQMHRLKLLIGVTILFSLLFVALIGYLLSRLLLKPVKSQVAALNRFIKDSTHEINTPVTALLMSVSALRKKGRLDKKLLRHITASARQIANTYNTLSHISFSDRKKEEATRFDLKTVVEKNIRFFEEIAAAKRIGIVSDLETTYVTMEKEDATRIVNNLLSNAIKYSHQNSEVTVTLKMNRLTVQDRGIGIKKEDLGRIFRRYTRASEIGGGFGIGLDIVNTICRKYGIVISVTSKEGEGTLFTLDFSAVASVGGMKN